MALQFYMDQHVPRAITAALRSRGVDVLTAYEDGMSEATDPTLLDRSSALGRVLFSRDEDFIREGARRAREGISFAGVVYAHQLRVAIGRCIEDLEVVAQAGRPEDVANRVTYLPL